MAVFKNSIQSPALSPQHLAVSQNQKHHQHQTVLLLSFVSFVVNSRRSS
jgi:hypothetical protein